ncbi:uncharacterized protein O3C94_015479 [Discoglossus pictus]
MATMPVKSDECEMDCDTASPQSVSNTTDAIQNGESGKPCQKAGERDGEPDARGECLTIGAVSARSGAESQRSEVESLINKVESQTSWVERHMKVESSNFQGSEKQQNTGISVNDDKSMNYLVDKHSEKGKKGSEQDGEPNEPGGEPKDRGGEPKDRGGEPEDRGGEPEDRGGEPEDRDGEPKDRDGEPKDRDGEPKDRDGEPKEQGEEPKEIGGEPKKWVGEPKERDGEPKELGGEPNKQKGSLSSWVVSQRSEAESPRSKMESPISWDKRHMSVVESSNLQSSENQQNTDISVNDNKSMNYVGDKHSEKAGEQDRKPVEQGGDPKEQGEEPKELGGEPKERDVEPKERDGEPKELGEEPNDQGESPSGWAVSQRSKAESPRSKMENQASWVESRMSGEESRIFQGSEKQLNIDISVNDNKSIKYLGDKHSEKAGEQDGEPEERGGEPKKLGGEPDEQGESQTNWDKRHMSGVESCSFQSSENQQNTDVSFNDNKNLGDDTKITQKTTEPETNTSQQVQQSLSMPDQSEERNKPISEHKAHSDAKTGQEVNVGAFPTREPQQISVSEKNKQSILSEQNRLSTNEDTQSNICITSPGEKSATDVRQRLIHEGIRQKHIGISDFSEKKSHERDVRDKEDTPKYVPIRSNCMFWAVAAGVAVLVLVNLTNLIWQPPMDTSKPSVLQIFNNEFENLRRDFPGQNEPLWLRSQKMLQKHLNKSSPLEPATIILTAARDAETTLRCLSERLARAYSTSLNASWIMIDGPGKSIYDSTTTKLQIDMELSSGFEATSRAAVLHRLEELPGGSLLILYKYCDHENAAFKNVALVLTVLLDEPTLEPNMSLTELEEKVRDFLWDKFTTPNRISSHNEMNADKLSGVWSRISHLVLPVLPAETVETSGCLLDRNE